MDITRSALSAVCLFWALWIAVFGPPEAMASEKPNAKQLGNSVVKITAVAQFPDYAVPWNPGRISTSTGTGFIISNNLILTNAHVSSNTRLMAVEKEGDARKYEAWVKFIAHDCDLAMLEVRDKSFFNGMAPLSLGGVPPLDSTVTVVGYPIGGDRLSVTRGVVSRIDYQLYSHSSADSHLAIQIDAAINPGNSGGPVFQDGRVVGVAFQGYSANVAQNVGYMIPTPVIQRFLTDIQDGTYDRYVDLGVKTFPLLNSAHRRALGLGPGDYGVVVSHVITAGSAAGILKVGDVLLSIEEFPIASDGGVVMDGQRVDMVEIVERKFKGDNVHIKILRDRKEMSVTIPLNLPWPYLLMSNRHDVRPRFVLFGGLVFQPLSSGFLKAKKIRNVDLLYHYSGFLDKELYLEKPEIVVISKVLPDPINAYLKEFTNAIVDKINGKPIRTLEDVFAAVREPAEYYVIQLTGKRRPVVLQRSEVEAARERILRGYDVGSEYYLGDSIVPKDWLSETPDRKLQKTD